MKLNFNLILILTSVLTVGLSTSHHGKCPKIAPNTDLTINAKLPDPFAFFADNSPVTTRKAWYNCRRPEIAELFQRYELGFKPGPPDELSSTFSEYANGTGGVLSITAANQNHGGARAEISWDVKVLYPNVTTMPVGRKGYPAIIALDILTVPQPDDVAVILFNVSEFAEQLNTSSRGKGKFYDLYPRTPGLSTSDNAGALMAWSWGVSRIVDALSLPGKPDASKTQIDPSRISVAGCSRYGKGALVAGAYDERLKLTIAQESGAGGSGCWRMLDVENQVVNGSDTTQTAREIVQENVWFSTRFEDFANVTNGVRRLPFDHHMLTGLVAPRGLLFVENLGYQWLGPWSAYGCQTAGRHVYEALGGKENVGFSQVSNHTHCQFPKEKQGGELGAFVERFLLDKKVATDVWRTEADFEVTFDEDEWVDWDVPSLG